MYVRIQTVDGQFFESDPVDMYDAQLGPQAWEQEVQATVELFQSWSEVNYIGLEIGGRRKFFNPANIIWAEVIV